MNWSQGGSSDEKDKSTIQICNWEKEIWQAIVRWNNKKPNRIHRNLNSRPSWRTFNFTLFNESSSPFLLNAIKLFSPDHFDKMTGGVYKIQQPKKIKKKNNNNQLAMQFSWLHEKPRIQLINGRLKTNSNICCLVYSQSNYGLCQSNGNNTFHLTRSWLKHGKLGNVAEQTSEKV